MATAGDRSVTASPLVIPAGASNATISVTLVDDDGAEGDETVVITLGAPSGAQLGASTIHTLTIDDDESDPPAPGTVFVVDDTYRLIRFDADSPQTVAFVDVEGVERTGPDNTLPLILAMDFRPSTGELYAYTSDRRFYRLDTSTGAATLIATTPVGVTTAGLLGLDFNPCVDALRAIGSEGENFRLTPSIGLIAHSVRVSAVRDRYRSRSTAKAAPSTPSTRTQTSLLRVNLSTGALTNLGQIGDGSSDVRVQALAIQP